MSHAFYTQRGEYLLLLHPKSKAQIQKVKRKHPISIKDIRSIPLIPNPLKPLLRPLIIQIPQLSKPLPLTLLRGLQNHPHTSLLNRLPHAPRPAHKQLGPASPQFRHVLLIAVHPVLHIPTPSILPFPFPFPLSSSARIRPPNRNSTHLLPGIKLPAIQIIRARSPASVE